MTSELRTRIAPSPTGDPHIGTAYIALFNYCLTKKHGGRFILRIEDTDRVRSTRASESKIIESLKWLGFDWDEGPDIGGECGPYRQSERLQIYHDHIKVLLDKGAAFHCFCSQERMEEVRKGQLSRGENPGYDGHCLQLSPEEVARKLDNGEEHVIRLRVPNAGSCMIHDLFRGGVEIDWSQVDMQVLMKTDGYPTYHFASVVDDHLMRITHVLRGEEWITSTPKHLHIYSGFGWEPPKYAHLPLLRNPDGTKLSKRRNPTSIEYYRRLGIVPEALVNNLGRMAWSMPDEKEKFELSEMIEAFDLSRVSMGGPRFDIEKLEWLNGTWLRDLSQSQFAEAVTSWAINKSYLNKVLPLVHGRVQKLSEMERLAGHFFKGLLDLKKEDLQFGKITSEEVQKLLLWCGWEFEGLTEWTAESIESAIRTVGMKLDVKIRQVTGVLFVVVTGNKVSTPLFATIEVTGKDLVLARMRQAVNTIGAIGKKKMKSMQSEYQAIK
ncbi:MAG: glutamate--tRNA ligase [Chromatiales bacterium]